MHATYSYVKSNRIQRKFDNASLQLFRSVQSVTFPFWNSTGRRYKMPKKCILVNFNWVDQLWRLLNTQVLVAIRGDSGFNLQSASKPHEMNPPSSKSLKINYKKWKTAPKSNVFEKSFSLRPWLRLATFLQPSHAPSWLKSILHIVKRNFKHILQTITYQRLLLLHMSLQCSVETYFTEQYKTHCERYFTITRTSHHLTLADTCL